ncbi:MAG: SNF2 helicase associated domain-containing protein [Bacilli bacterium]|nr:SNF2 helicase associated domain-containing protein [Bacilli bacterium]
MDVLELLNHYRLEKLNDKENELFTYFAYSYAIENDENNHPSFRISLFSKISRIAVLDFVISYKGQISYACQICRDKQPCYHFSILVTKLLTDEYEQIKALSERFNYEVGDVDRREQQAAFDYELKQVFEEIRKEDIASASTKARLKIYLEDTRFSYSVNLTIAKGKEYRIASIDRFLNRFINEEEFRYGKDLTIVHRLSSFDETSQRIIKILRKAEQNSFIDLNNESSLLYLDSLLDALKDDYLYINNEVYHVEKDAMDVKIVANDNYSLSVQGLIKGYIPLTRNYYICKSANSVKPLTNNKYINYLIDSTINYPLSTVRENFDNFKYSFFEKYPEFFILSDEIKELMNTSSLRIEAYFDYDKDNIYEKTRYLKNEEGIDPNKVTNFYEVSQIKHYQEILSSYGFFDHVLTDGGLVWDFLNSTLDNLRKVATLYFSKNLENRSTSSFASPNISIKKEGSMLEVLVDNSVYSDEELKAILIGLKRKKKFVKIGDNFISLLSDDTKKFYDFAKDFDLINENSLNKKKEVPLYYAFKAYGNDNSFLSMDSYLDEVFTDLKGFSDSNVDIPKINGELRPYQVDGVKWLTTLYKYSLGGILADDMGLGKTIETIAFINTIKNDKPILIVSPKSLVFNWVSEFNKFAKDIPVYPIIGTVEERKKIIKKIKNDKFGVFFISYDSLRNEYENLTDFTFDLVILDEAQFIKNMHAKKTNAVKQMNALHTIALTGTPIENNIYDLWSIFDFLMPHYLLDYEDFKDSYESDEEYVKIVKNKVAPFILRRRKEDVLKDLPEKYEVIMTTEMSIEQRKLYDAFRLKAKEELKSKDGGSHVMEVLSIITRLRQICVDPSTFVDNFTGESGKITMLKEIITDKLKDNHRFLIFSQFVSALNIVKEEIEKMGIKYFMITGDTRAKERLRICNDFNNDEDYKIVLISLKAGGTGLNLVGADVVIHLDPWWNYSAQNQASDRAHRIGQTRTVEVIKLIAENSIEERVVSLQDEKKELVDKVISNDDSSIKKLSIKDLKSILNM